MRLWHKDLIPVLPRQQLLGQWREVCLIAKNMTEFGTPNHVLVNKVTEYPMYHLQAYAYKVYKEMKKRGYKPDIHRFTKYAPFYIWLSHKDLYSEWHNDRYFLQCYYNLQEKYDCGGISDGEFQMITKIARKRIKK